MRLKLDYFLTCYISDNISAITFTLDRTEDLCMAYNYAHAHFDDLNLTLTLKRSVRLVLLVIVVVIVLGVLVGL